MKRYIISILLILLVIQSLGLAEDLIVPSRKYHTIQSAIDAAAFLGDTIILLKNPNSYYPVSYSGSGNVNLDFHGKAITIKSEINLGAPEPDWDTISSTIIDCGGLPYSEVQDDPNANRAFRFHTGEAENSRVIGLTIINGYARGPKGADGWVGYIGYPLDLFRPVLIDPEDDPCDVPPYAIDGNDAAGDGYAGAILCDGASPTIKYCIIRDCTVSGAHGGKGADGLWGEWDHWTIADFNQDTGELNPDAEITEDNPDGQWGGRGGRGEGQGYGGAIACLNNSSPDIIDCYFINNMARGGRGGDGGRGGNADGIFFQDGDWGIGGDANDSIGSGVGGIIYAEGGCNPHIEGCYFSNNAALTGERALGGENGLGKPIDVEPPIPPSADGLVRSGGSTQIIAGGVAYSQHGSDMNFINCTFKDNRAYEAYPFYHPSFGEDVMLYTAGGAVFCEGGDVLDTVTLNTCDFTNNLGGAVYIGSHCELNINNDYAVLSGNPDRRCLFQGNSADGFSDYEELSHEYDASWASGGAILVDGDSHVDIRNCNFGGNWAEIDGGAIKTMSDATFVNCSFGYNTANGRGGGFTGFGGAIDAYGPHDLVLDFNNCSFNNNQAVYGGGFSTEDFTATFNDCYFIGNIADMGGAMDLGYGDISFTGGVITANQANNGDGGGLNYRNYVTSDTEHAEIRNCILQNNSANGDDSSGGAIMLMGSSPFKLENCVLAGNHAAVDGGGIFCYGTSGANPEIKSCTFSSNTTDSFGGAVFANAGSSPEITDCIFKGCNSHAIHEEDYGGDATTSHCLFFGNLDGAYYDSGTGITYSGSSQVDSIPGGVANRYGDPLFLTGPLGGYYLKQSPPQSLPSSSAVNKGSVDLSDPNFDPNIYGWDPRLYTTRTDSVGDTGWVDIGYHYPDIAGIEIFQLTASVVGGSGTIQPTSGTYYAGTVVTLTAKPTPGWLVDTWTGTDNDASVSKTNIVVMNSNRVVNVSFRQPKSLYVKAPGGDPDYYSTIQAAVSDAQDGDTVVVYPGIYYGGYRGIIVYVDKSITIRSVYPEDPCCVADTIIDGYWGLPVAWNYDGVYFGSNTDSDTVFNGFTIRNCGGQPADGLDGDRGQNRPNGEDGYSVYGAGMVIQLGGSPIIKNCVIRNNWVLGGNGGNGVSATNVENAGRGGWCGWARGAGVYCQPDSSPTFINCQILDNTVQGGDGGNGGDGAADPGGEENYGGNWSIRGTPELAALDWNPFTLEVTYVTDSNLWEVWDWDPDQVADYWEGFYGIYDRTSYFGDYRWYSGYGGGVYIDWNCNVKFENCVIRGNSASGGMSGVGGADFYTGRLIEPVLAYEIPSFGGGVYCAAGSTVTFTDCTITDNVSSELIEDNHRLDPYIGRGGGICAEDSASLIFENCRFEENSASIGGGLHAGNTPLRVIDCEFISNTAYQGAGLFGNNKPITILRSDFFENSAIPDINDPNVRCRGGGLHILSTDASIVDCNINGNLAETAGGGIYFSGEGNPSLFNCVVSNNTAGRDGGGISINVLAQLGISNCTVVDNETSGIGYDLNYGGGLYCSPDTHAVIINSILWGNASDNGAQIAIVSTDISPSGASVSYSDVEGAQSGVYMSEDSELVWGAGNMNKNPRFVTGPFGDYYLSQIDAGQINNSPCVNVGSDLAKVFGLNRYTTRTDDQLDRGMVDMGYHYPFSFEINPCSYYDLEYDGIINYAELAIIISRWLDDDCSSTNNWCGRVDATYDRVVNFEDFAQICSCWLIEDYSAPQPDPAEWEIEPEPDTDSPSTAVRMSAVRAVDAWAFEVEYYFECVYGGCQDSGWQDEPNYIDQTLDPNTEYGYRVRVKDKMCIDHYLTLINPNYANGVCDTYDPDDPNAPNKTGWTAVRYVLTEEGGGQQPGAPAAPSGLVAEAISSEEIDLSWTDNSSDELGFGIERRTGGGSYQLIDDGIPANETEYSDEGLEIETEYSYRVYAYNANGNSAYSNVATETTLSGAADTIPPDPAPEIISASEYMDSYYYWHFWIIATATAVDDSGGPVYYRVFCIEDSALDSDIIPDNDPDDPGNPYDPYIIDGVLVYRTPSKASYYGSSKNYVRTFIVCVYDQADNEACSVDVTIDRYTKFPPGL